jgi:hypothetical protein
MFKHRPKLGILRKNAGELVEIIVSTAMLAENISAKVRQLDLEQVRILDSHRSPTRSDPDQCAYLF